MVGASVRVLGRGLLVTYIGLVILIPLAALLGHAGSAGWSGFWAAITNAQALDAIELTLGCAAAATAINAVVGLAVAWVLVRDRFSGQGALNSVIDLPFALPTVVAGVTFLSLYGPYSPVHLDLAGTWFGVTVAIMFVTLPFTVRSVQPVLESMDFHAEAAAATLGARPVRIFTTITLPSLAPAILTGSGLCFARAIGEYGSVVFISGNEPYHTEVASSYVYSLVGGGQFPQAASVAVALLAIALIVLGAINLLGRRLARRRG